MAIAIIMWDKLSPENFSLICAFVFSTPGFGNKNTDRVKKILLGAPG